MSNTKQVDQATPTITQPTNTDAKKVAVAQALVAQMAKSPLWATSPDVQAAAKAWGTSATNLTTNVAAIAALKTQLKVAEAAQLTLRRSWRVAKKQVLSTVDTACAGSADAVKGFSFDVLEHEMAPPQAAPSGLVGAPGASPGEATIKWSRGSALHGFLVQHATDAANATTYSAVSASTKTRYTLGGLAPSGSAVWVRVAAIDPHAASGQSPWSAWVSATVR
jgi:hypothetical protein